MAKRTTMAVVGLFIILIAVWLITVIAGDIKTFSYIGREFADKNIITVSGKGEMNVKPDSAVITMGKSKTAATVAEAQGKVTDLMNKAIKVLKDNGVEEKDIKTANYSIQPKYEYQRATKVTEIDLYPYGKQVLVGYEVSQSVEVKIRNLDKVGAILSAVGEIGLDNVYGPNFVVEKQDELTKQVRAEAIKDAQDNANRLAKDLNVKLVRLVSYADGSGYSMYRTYDTMAKASGLGMAESAPAPIIPAGENKITANVTLVYEIR